jgi:hypothetical protein
MNEVTRIVATRQPAPRFSGLPDRKVIRIARLDEDGLVERYSKFGAGAGLVDSKILERHGSSFQLAKEARTWDNAIKASREFHEIFDELESSIAKRNLPQVNQIATRYLASQPVVLLEKMHPAMQAVLKFMPGWDGKEHSLIRFVSELKKGELSEFVESAPEQVTKLKTQMMCAMAQRELGRLPCDLTAMLRSVVAFDPIARHATSDKDIANIPHRLARELIHFHVELPSFLFFDICDLWTEEVNSESHLGRVISSRKTDDTSRQSKDAENPCDCDCDVEPVCTLPTPCCPDLHLFVADYFTLESSTKCYVPGDLAYIENIAPFEKRERKHSFEETVATTTEQNLTEERNAKRDHTFTDRATLEDALEAKLSLESVTEGKYGSEHKYISGKLTASVDLTAKRVRNEFKERVDQVVTEINRSTETKRSQVVTTIEKEENTHAFNNETAEPASSKYFYVNREVQGQVLSYDLRAQIEIFLPQPAAMLEYLERERLERAFTMKKPKAPSINKEDLKPEFHSEYVAQYGVQGVSPPPTQSQPIKYESVVMQKNDTPKTVTIPNGYTATYLGRDGGIIRRSWPGFMHLTITAGGRQIRLANNSNWDGGPLSATQSLECVVTHNNVTKNSYISGKITLTPDPVDLGPWRDEMYSAIMALHAADLAAYEEAYAAYMADAKGQMSILHPLKLEQLVRTEIKRAAIYMMCGDFETPSIINLKSVPCGAPTINRVEADQYLRDKYFWDRAFDWELMMFQFYDYIFGHYACEWPYKYLPAHDNKMYSDFLSAGRARVLIPVASGMENDVTWYIQTGEVWGQSGMPPIDPGDPRYINLVTEIAHSKNCFQTEREGRIEGIFDAGALTHQVLLTGTDAYWDYSFGSVDSAKINADKNRYIYIDGEKYVIANIEPDPNAMANPQTQWIITLDRIFEGAATLDSTTNTVFPNHAFAIGALLVGAPFTWVEWTNMVWIGDQENKCLPCYPVKC